MALLNAHSEEAELKRYGYVLGMKLDEGAYSKVREGYDPDKRRVAIKIINKKKCDKEFRTKFLPRELQIFSALLHPNIVEIYDIIHIRYNVYIVMEYAGKDNLQNYLKLRGKLPEPRARNMMASILGAIEYLHNKDIAHRDLKCGNILINSRNQLKITDFGFARIMVPDKLSETFCGSIAYSAPEVLQKIPYRPRLQDVWGLGVITYQMVVGKLPFDEMNMKKMIRVQTKQQFELPQHLSVAIKELIQSVLEPNPDKRLSLAGFIAHPWFMVMTGRERTWSISGTSDEDDRVEVQCPSRKYISQHKDASPTNSSTSIETSRHTY